jgi:Putative abortive phage resistance protein AbiGi, antitoxin
MGKISQNLSSDSLFHFVRQRDWLLEILKRKAFQARFVYEDLPALKQKLGIPMKCFSDIPLGLIKKHMSVYGRYGIGVTKSFAKSCSLSPIIYIHDKSDTVNRYLANLKNVKTLNAQNSLIPYFKLEEGYVINTDGKRVKRRFYDEREWRYVPKNAEPINFEGFDEDEIRKTKLDYENNQLISNTSKYLLPLEYGDITYLIVENINDVSPLIKAIRSLKINDDVPDKLISKIITAKQIERDF